MPIISLFFGIVIRLNTRGEHNPPHLHAAYGGQEAAFDIATGEVIGNFPTRQTRMVQAWIEIHREDLMENWKLAVTTGECFKIDPLR